MHCHQLLFVVWEPPGEQCLMEDTVAMREPLWKSRVLAEKVSAPHRESKTFKFGCRGAGKRNSLTSPASPLPQRSRAQCQESCDVPWEVCVGGESVGVNFPSSPAVCPVSPSPYRVRRPALRARGQGEAGQAPDRTFGRHSREAGPRSLQDLSCRSP